MPEIPFDALQVFFHVDQDSRSLRAFVTWFQFSSHSLDHLPHHGQSHGDVKPIEQMFLSYVQRDTPLRGEGLLS
jgi:hypothetical protein